MKTEPVHGVESAGLGTSTFLEGAPAPKSAIEKANAAALLEDEDGVLARKKSIVQKIKSRRATTNGDRSPPPPPPMNGSLLTSTGTTATAVDPAYNPFFKEGQFIERVESLPATSRERADSGGSDKAGTNTSGLLGRVKSLKISSGRSKGRKSEE